MLFHDHVFGLHFDGVDAVFILGVPDSPSTYLHLAGRTGRQPVLTGTVVTICPGRAFRQLEGWSPRLGGIRFDELRLQGIDDAEAPADDEADEADAAEYV